MTEKAINLKAVQKAFGVSDKTVRNWIDAGMPCEKTKKGYHFILSACIQWREVYLQSMKKGSDEFEKAKTEREIWRAKTAKLNYEKMSGLLVYAADVRETAFESGRMLRDQLLNIPARVSPIIAAERDTKKVNEILTHEIRQCLETIAGDLIEEGKSQCQN